MNRGTWQATVHRVTKSQTRLNTHTKLYCKLEFQDVLSHPKPLLLEKAMAPHSSTLAWRIPWTEEPGGLQSMGSLRVGHD